MLGFEIPDGNAGEPARKPDTEKEATKIEKEKPEHIPTPEEVRSLFEKLVGEADYEEIQKLEDEQGLYLWDIKITQADGSIEYSYIRKGNYRKRGLPGGSSPDTAIHRTGFDKDGMPGGGIMVAKCVDGGWKIFAD